MSDTSELVESEPFEKSGWRRRGVWVLLVLVVGCWLWVYMVSRRPMAPEGWKVVRESALDALAEGSLRRRVSIHSPQHLEQLEFRVEVTDEVVEWFASQSGVQFMEFHQCDFSAVDLHEMKWMADLHTVRFIDSALGDEQLAGLAGASNVERLWMINGQAKQMNRHLADSTGWLEAEFSKAGLKSLWGMRKLSTLRLARMAIGDSGFEGIGGLTRMLDLELEYCAMKGAALKEIGQMKNVMRLNLTGNPIEDASLAYLAGSPRLLMLHLSDTTITDAGLVHLTKLRKLDRLYLRETAVTMEGLKVLSGAPKLKEVYLGKEFVEKHRDEILEFKKATGIDVRN